MAEATYKLKTTRGVVYPLYVTNNLDFGDKRKIVVFESATGDGGVTYDNGRITRRVPIDGELIGKNTSDLDNKKKDLQRLHNTGAQVMLIGKIRPYPDSSNKYHIEELKFSIGSNERTSSFTMTLVESKSANIKTVQVNLVNFGPAELLRQTARNRGISGQ